MSKGQILPGGEKKASADSVDADSKEPSYLKKWLPFALFYGIVSQTWPFVVESRLHMLITFFCWLSFFALSIPIYRLGRIALAHISPPKQNEVLNRVVSIGFNLLTGVPSYLAWYRFFPGFLPTFAELAEGRTSMMDIFACITIGYSLYDFPTLAQTFGRGAALIQLHHCVEMVIVAGYCGGYGTNAVASIYLLGGGMMQISSGIIHIERIMSITKAPQTLFTRLWRWFLIANWTHSRLVVWPYMMWYCYNAQPLGVMHVFLIVVGTLLTIMNAQWLYKIVNIKSLAY